MLGYDFEIIYKKGKYNVVVDALSRTYKDDGSLFSLSSPVLEYVEEARQEWLVNDSTTEVIKRLQEDPNHPLGYTWKKDTLRYKGHLFWYPTLL